jgi:hypothetical protein
MDSTVAAIARQIESQISARLKDVWDSRLTQADRELVSACCQDAAELQVRAMATPPDTDAQAQLLREKAQINAQLANLATLQAQQAVDALWEVVRIVTSGAMKVALAGV